MERTVPRSSSEGVELYLRTIYSLLRSTDEIQIKTLEESHMGMNSLLHPDTRKNTLDVSAFIYSWLRLPDIIPNVTSVVLGQSSELFKNAGYQNFENWTPVSSKARRRRCYFDDNNTLACYIASRSDIDDIVPCLVAYQIEWNKLHLLLQEITSFDLPDKQLSERLQLSIDDLNRLKTLWDTRFYNTLELISKQKMNLKIRLLGGSLSDYWRATTAWWTNIENIFPDLVNRPLYFVSSNMHSITNLLSGFTKEHSNDITRFIKTTKPNETHLDLEDENLFYYYLKLLQESDSKFLDLQNQHEKYLGITRIRSTHYFDVDAQVIEINKLNPKFFDKRISNSDMSYLQDSDAIILNIDYPLGYSAYHILSKVAEYSSHILGVYSMGKAASLNGKNGDIMIPNVCHDEHSQNTYLFRNAFSASDVSPFLCYGTVLDNQKSVSVLGTFLQSSSYMNVFYTEGFSDIEMECGPFLSSVYEMFRPKRHPSNEIINLYGVPFDIGFLHYVSDTPLSKGRNLGAGKISYFGIDSTYASSIAVIRRIFQMECTRNKECS